MERRRSTSNSRVHPKEHHPLYVRRHRKLGGNHIRALLLEKWKEDLKLEPGQLTGFMRHNLWPLGTINLPFTLTSHENANRKTALIDFVIIRNSSEHNVMLGGTNLLMFVAISSTIHEILKFSTSQGPGMVLDTSPQVLKCYVIMQPKEIFVESKRPRSEL